MRDTAASPADVAEFKALAERKALAQCEKLEAERDRARMRADQMRGTLVERRLVNAAFQEVHNRITSIRKDLRRKGDTVGTACLESAFRGVDDAIDAILEGREIRSGG